MIRDTKKKNEYKKADKGSRRIPGFVVARSLVRKPSHVHARARHPRDENQGVIPLVKARLINLAAP